MNCVPAPAVAAIMKPLRSAAADIPIGAYANTSELGASGRWTDTPATDPDVYARHASEWLAAGATLIGGCCGTTPPHIARLNALITFPD
jgi:homocysteine S-methyltransferase